MTALKNEFTWSKSRDETFRRCPRQYYYHYYGSWGGWNRNADERTWKMYILKKLMNRAAWVGSRVHECIEQALLNTRRGIPPMSEGEAIDTTIAIMRQDYTNSKNGGYWKNPKSCGLFEHEYKTGISDEDWKASADHAAHCLQTFYRSEVYQAILGIPAEHWLEIEDFSHFLLEGTKVWVVMDFCCRSGPDIYIYDWKTGSAPPEHHEVQLAGYSCYAIEKWGVGPRQIKTVEFNLGNGKVHFHHPEGVHLDSVRKYILGSIRDMKLLLDNTDSNTASEARFAFAESEKSCDTCSFKSVCARWA